MWPKNSAGKYNIIDERNQFLQTNSTETNSTKWYIQILYRRI